MVDAFRDSSLQSILTCYYLLNWSTFKNKKIRLIGFIAKIAPDEVKQTGKALFKDIAIGLSDHNSL